MSEIGACFSEPPLRLEGSVGQSGVKHIEDGDGASAAAQVSSMSTAAYIATLCSKKLGDTGRLRPSDLCASCTSHRLPLFEAGHTNDAERHASQAEQHTHVARTKISD